MVFLGDRSDGRDNNLNFIRAIAATAVLISHAYPLTLGMDTLQPFTATMGFSLGTMAVYVFFAVSGFLISMSFMRTSSWLSFLVARVLRLWPGLFVSLVFIAFVLGPLVSDLGPRAYLGEFRAWTYVPQNMSLAFLQYRLPGVFPTVGSIWTLVYEVACYMGVFALGIMGILKSRVFMLVFLAVYAVFWVYVETQGAIYRVATLQDLSLPFVVGMYFYQFRDRLGLSFAGVVLLAGLSVILSKTLAYEPLLVLTLAYATFWLAYIPGGAIRRYNAIGDYSYGIYIYAFPLQGLAIWAFGADTPVMNMIVSFPITLIFAIASWHFVEKPAMDMKPWVMARLGRPVRTV